MHSLNRRDFISAAAVVAIGGCAGRPISAAAAGQTIRFQVHADRPLGDAHRRIGDFMRLEMAFVRGDEAELAAYRSVGFTGEKSAAFFSPAASDPGYGGFVVTLASDRARPEDRVQLSTTGFDAGMRDFVAGMGRPITTFNLNEMPIALASPDCVRAVGASSAAGCNPADLDLWRIAMTKALTHVSQTYRVDLQLQLFGEAESRENYRAFGARNADAYESNEDYAAEEERLADDYLALAVATAEAVRAVNRRFGRRHLVTLYSPGVYSQQLMRDLNAGLPRMGMEGSLERLEAFNAAHPESPLTRDVVAMGVQLYDWDSSGDLTRSLAHLERLHARHALPFYVYGTNASWTSEAVLAPHRNAAYVIGGVLQMLGAPFMRESYGYTWSRIGEGDDLRHSMFDPETNRINAYAAGYQALGRLRGAPGVRFATLAQSGTQNGKVMGAATVDRSGAATLLIVNNSPAPKSVSIVMAGVGGRGAPAQQFWHIGPASDGGDYGTQGLDDAQSGTFERALEEPMTLDIMPYALLLVRGWRQG